jgi:L-threonylcarbamoyladenylate synthase
MPRIVDPTPAAIAQAVDLLRAGHVVAVPTETVYGLGADAMNDTAIERVYQCKGRPANNPLIAHVADAAQAAIVVAHWDARCQLLAQMFWPGPLTLVLAKSPSVPMRATAGYNTIAVRCPNHPVMAELLLAFGGPIVAPSANRSGHVSPTRADHVARDFAACEDLLILDGGSCELGIESTVLDLSGQSPVILRPGAVSPEALGDVLRDTVQHQIVSEQLASPGTAMSHYAPRTPVMLMPASEVASLLSQQVQPVVCLSMTVPIPPPHLGLTMPTDAAGYASMLYAALREADAHHAQAIVIELPDVQGSLWDAIRDRLHRAAAPRL